MEAALKEAKDEAAKKIAEAKKGSKQSLTKATPAETKTEVKKPTAPSLFDAPGETDGASSATVAAGTTAALSRDESENDESYRNEALQSPATNASEALGTAAVQPGIFDTSSEEDEILQEAFYGTQDSHIAA